VGHVVALLKLRQSQDKLRQLLGGATGWRSQTVVSLPQSGIIASLVLEQGSKPWTWTLHSALSLDRPEFKFLTK
jgi:hypothetical protein